MTKNMVSDEKVRLRYINAKLNTAKKMMFRASLVAQW